MTPVEGAALQALEEEIVSCRRCPRLVAWREEVARVKRASFADETYWGRPVPGFGDPAASLVILGLAPAAHGGNRTGRVFTGDRSGDWLFAALHRAGYANQPTSRTRDDGLALHDCYVPPRCGAPRRPTSPPRPSVTPACPTRCASWSCSDPARVIVCLGAFAWDAALRLLASLGHERLRPRPRFGHGAEAVSGRFTLLGCFHPSQQNTFTGRLTEDMLDTIFIRARELSAAR